MLRKINIDTSEKKVGAFVSTWITLALAGIALFACFDLSSTISAQTGLESLSQIVTVPILLILYISLTALTISSVATSIMSIFSTNKAIKIISIFLLLISLAMVGLEIWTLVLVL